MQRITEPVPYTPTDPEQEARADYMREQANLQGRGAPAYTVPIQAQPREASTGQDTRYIPPAPNRNPYGVAPAQQPVTSRRIRPTPQPAKPAEEMPLWAIIWAIALGAAVALATVPMWVPVLGNSIIGAE